MDVGNGEVRSLKKALLSRGYKSSFLVMLGCSGVQYFMGDNVVYSGLCFPHSCTLGLFFQQQR